MQRKFDFYCGIFFRFSKSGPVHTLLTPVSLSGYAMLLRGL